MEGERTAVQWTGVCRMATATTSWGGGDNNDNVDNVADDDDGDRIVGRARQ